MSLQLAVLARAPVPGQCKTRLIPALGEIAAARLHAALVRRTLEQALKVPDTKVTLWTAGDPEHTFFQQLRSDWPALHWQQQSEGDLGERMHQVFANNQQTTLLIGSDCPVITPELLLTCAEALQHHEAVFLPAEDGGYALVGLHKPCLSLFQKMTWGHNQVMQQTRERLQQQDMHWAELQTVWDVDRPEDVERLAEGDSLL